MRLAGEKSGINRPGKRLIRKAEELEIIYPFYTDSEGIFKAKKNYNWENGRFGKNVAINSNGFRGIEFCDYVSDKKRILFLGDSFTWGASAEPITNCFVDLVSEQGYLAFNTGIPGTDPGQYAYLAKKYVPVLKPDFVIAMVYMGNDLTVKPSPMIPDKNLFYITDDIWLFAFDENNRYLTFEESFYRYYYLDHSPDLLKNKLKYIFSSTVIGKKFWQFIKSFKNKKEDTYKRTLSNDILNLFDQIKKISTENNARFMLFIIPAHPLLENVNFSKKEIAYIFKNLELLIPENLSHRDYSVLPDDHFNNSGHLKMSRYIIDEIDKPNR